MSAVAAKLREARKLIAKGWCRNDFGWGGKVCATGAIHAAVSGDPHNCSAECEEVEIALAMSALESGWSTAGSALVNWNDAPGRTQAEVLAAFDRAIELAESEAA